VFTAAAGQAVGLAQPLKLIEGIPLPLYADDDEERILKGEVARHTYGKRPRVGDEIWVTAGRAATRLLDKDLRIDYGRTAGDDKSASAPSAAAPVRKEVGLGFGMFSTFPATNVG
jgi:hypothetical protein